MVRSPKAKQAHVPDCPRCTDHALKSIDATVGPAEEDSRLHAPTKIAFKAACSCLFDLMIHANVLTVALLVTTSCIACVESILNTACDESYLVYYSPRMWWLGTKVTRQPEALDKANQFRPGSSALMACRHVNGWERCGGAATSQSRTTKGEEHELREYSRMPTTSCSARCRGI